MSVWFCIPAKKPAIELQVVIERWHAMGYKVAIWRDPGDDLVLCDYLQQGKYPGYAKAVNALASVVLEFDETCDWIVTGGDDTDPDPRLHADVIARQCSRHFGKGDILEHGDAESLFGTYGVMQPTGDRYAGGSIDRIAGSPWLGREWCLRANKGAGPLHPDFYHMFVDEFLMQSAMKQGVFWQRPDLIHFHRHFMRESESIDSNAVSKPVPRHAQFINSSAHWSAAQGIFRNHKINGFSAGDPIPA